MQMYGNTNERDCKGTEKQRTGQAKGRKSKGKERMTIRKDGNTKGRKNKGKEKQR